VSRYEYESARSEFAAEVVAACLSLSLFSFLQCRMWPINEDLPLPRSPIENERKENEKEKEKREKRKEKREKTEKEQECVRPTENDEVLWVMDL